MTHPQHPRASRPSQRQPQENITPQQSTPQQSTPQQSTPQGLNTGQQRSQEVPPRYQFPSATPNQSSVPESPANPQIPGTSIQTRLSASQHQSQPHPQPVAQYVNPGQAGAPVHSANQPGKVQPTSSAPQQPTPNKLEAQDPFNTPWYKKPINWIFALLAFSVVIFLIGLVGIFTNSDEHDGNANNAAGTSVQPASEVMAPLPQEYEVTYRILGNSTDVAVTYNNGEQTNAQEQGVGPGWEISTTVSESFGAYLFTTNGIDEEGETTCQVEANGIIIAEDSATGPLSEAFCNPSNADLAAAFE